MASKTFVIEPFIGMPVAFTRRASESLADIQAQVIAIWPPLRSGDYLVTLEYPHPVKIGDRFIRRIDALMSQLYTPISVQPGSGTTSRDRIMSYGAAALKQRILLSTVCSATN
jgi:hypothetical protein